MRRRLDEGLPSEHIKQITQSRVFIRVSSFDFVDRLLLGEVWGEEVDENSTISF